MYLFCYINESLAIIAVNQIMKLNPCNTSVNQPVTFFSTTVLTQ